MSRAQIGDCGGPPEPGKDPTLGLSWLLEDETSEPLSRIVTLWQGKSTVADCLSWVLSCPVQFGVDFATMVADKPGDPDILVLRSASTGLKFQEAVVQKNVTVLLWPSTFRGARALAPPDFQISSLPLKLGGPGFHKTA